VDAIQCSKFISAKKSDALIKKLTGLVSRYEAEQLKRQIVVQGRVKSMNESIYYCVDDLHRAIAENHQVSFDYMQWSTGRKMIPHRADPYIVSPWALTWDDENYYLIAYDEEADSIKHFRVDKIKSIKILPTKRVGADRFKEFNLARYSKMSFGMFGGEPTRVKIAFADELVGVFIDRFGRDIPIHPASRPGWSETSVDVSMSDHFLSWIFALGENVLILSPDTVVAEFKRKMERLGEMYK
jgi:predicted DNA-binding transcriptional regulator YafY